MRHGVIKGLLVTILVCLCAAGSTGTAAPVSSGELTRKTQAAQQLLDEYYGDSRSLTRAQQYLNEVLTQNPDFVPGQLQTARLVLMGGHIVSSEFAGGTLEAARAILLRAKRLDPTNPEVHVLLGHLHRLEEDPAAALEALETARSLKSTNPWLHDNYGDVFFQQQEWAKADEHYRLVEARGVGKTPQQRKAFTYALTKRQQIAMFRDDDPEVKRLGKLATAAAAPQDAWTWGEVANVLFIQGFFDESIQNSRTALSIMEYGVGRNNLALGLYGKWAQLTAEGRAADAERYFAEAYSLTTDLIDVQMRFQGAARSVIKLTPIVRKRQVDIANGLYPQYPMRTTPSRITTG